MRIRNFLNPLPRVEIFESANNLELCGRANPDIFESDDVAKSGLIFIDANKAIATWEKHTKQTLFMLKWVWSLHFDAKLTAFFILAFFRYYTCRSWNIPKEIIRIQYSRLGSKRRYYNSSIVSRKFFICKYNIILYLILAKVNLTGVFLLSLLDLIALHTLLAYYPNSLAWILALYQIILLMTKYTNLSPNSHITLDALLCAYFIYNITEEYWALHWIPISAGYVWTGEFDSNTLRVDTNFLNPQQKISGFKNIRISVDGD